MSKWDGGPGIIGKRIGFGLRIHAFFGHLIHFKGDDVRRFLRAAGDALEILSSEALGLGWLHVPDQNQRDILWRIKSAEKLVRVRLRDRGNVRGPAYGWPRVRRGLPKHRVELLGKF